MITFAQRNWRIYLRDRAAVLYSLMAVFIIVGLYVLFLGDNLVKFVSAIKDGRFFVDSWIMAGLIAVSSLTTPLGALGTIIDDRTLHIDKDFRASPLRRSDISGGYLLSAVWVGFFMCCVTLVLAEVYIVLKGGSILPFVSVVKLLGVMLLSSVTSSTMLFPLLMSVRSGRAFGGISTVIGTLVGFVTGMYIPIGEVPTAVQWVMKCFPTTHASALMRQIMTETPAGELFAGAPAVMRTTVEGHMGITLTFGKLTFTPWMHIAVLMGTAAVFFLFSVLLVSRRKRG